MFDAANCEIRDVQIHPFHINYCASANDNGIIHFWDIRQTGKEALKQYITGHQGVIFSIDWHHTYGNLLATAGRDRLIKVWDLKLEGKPAHVIQTIASVGKIKWKPGSVSHIASTHAVNDSRIHIWDSERPNIPCYSLTTHNDVVTGLAFDHRDLTGNTIISGSKDGTLRISNILNESYRHFDHLPNSSIAWTPRNDFVYSHEYVQRSTVK